MNIPRSTNVLVIVLWTIAAGGHCAAQIAKVSSDDIMDAAFDMKKAAEQADKLDSDGRKHCGWGIASADASDLSDAISRFLLNHGSRVRENVPASKMWRVSFAAGDLIHRLAVGQSECILKLRYSDDARSVDVAASAIIMKFTTAKERFDALAYQQTRWQEQNTLQMGDNARAAKGDPPAIMEVGSERTLSAAHDIKQAAEAAGKVTTEAATTSGCLRSPSKLPDLTELTKLIEYLEHAPHSPSHIPAANMWGVINGEVSVAQLDILITIQACSPYAGEKKKARNVATEALQAYHRLTAAIASFDVLALQQTEWEEQTSERQAVVQEQ